MTETWTELVRALRLDLLAYLLLAIVLGGAVGVEREIKGKPAGLRTNILICVGAALFTQLSLMIAGTVGDPGRIAAQIVTGVGFLGAGTIIQSRGQITGLTSAATIWLVAAIGVAVGYGAVLEAAGATVLVLLVLGALGHLEKFLERRSHTTRISLAVAPEPGRMTEIEQLVRNSGLSVEEIVADMHDKSLVVTLTMRGPKALHDGVKLALLSAFGDSRLSVEE